MTHLPAPMSADLHGLTRLESHFPGCAGIASMQELFDWIARLRQLPGTEPPALKSQLKRLLAPSAIEFSQTVVGVINAHQESQTFGRLPARLSVLVWHDVEHGDQTLDDQAVAAQLGAILTLATNRRVQVAARHLSGVLKRCAENLGGSGSLWPTREVAMARRLTFDQKRRIRRLCREGKPLKEVAVEVGCHLSTGMIHSRRKEQADWTTWSTRGGLKLADREEISLGIARGETYTQIARRLGRCVSTVTREVAKNGGSDSYRATDAQLKAYKCARRPKGFKFEDPRLQKVVTHYLQRLWSPEQIAKRLPIEFPDDPMMWVSHETIYKSIYVQGRGELKTELYRCLRSGRGSEDLRTPPGPPGGRCPTR